MGASLSEDGAIFSNSNVDARNLRNFALSDLFCDVSMATSSRARFSSCVTGVTGVVLAALTFVGSVKSYYGIIVGGVVAETSFTANFIISNKYNFLPILFF